MSTVRSWLLRVLLVVVVASAMTLLGNNSASAGTLQVRDNDGLFSAADVAALRREAEALPFDVRLLTSADRPEKSDFERYVHEQVTTPGVVVIGVDKTHRHTVVHFGTATGVPASAYRTIEQAGNSAFREGNWGAGISAILDQTRAAARPGNASSPVAPVRAANGASTAMWGLIVVLVVAGLIVFVGVTLARRARNGMLGAGAQAALAPGAAAPGYPSGAGYAGYAGPTPGSAPGYGYSPGYGAGGGIGRNIAAAGLGGLVGYELGKMAGDHDRPHEVPEHAADLTGAADPQHVSPDAGGAAGSWDDDAQHDRGDTGDSSGSDWGGDSGGGDWAGESGGGDGGGGDW